MIKIFSEIPNDSKVIIDGSKNVWVDDDIAELVEDFKKRAPQQNITVTLKKSSLALSPIFKEESYG